MIVDLYLAHAELFAGIEEQGAVNGGTDKGREVKESAEQITLERTGLRRDVDNNAGAENDKESNTNNKLLEILHR